MIAGAGTGGTLTGLSKKLKEHNAACLVIGVDPVGSKISRPEALNILKEGESDLYKVEGIGYDFIPEVLNHDAIDHWIKTNDQESFSAARRIIRTEGILCGGSCGSALAGALKYLKSEEGYKKFGGVEGVNVVILLADS